jgi:hypothetical protein
MNWRRASGTDLLGAFNAALVIDDGLQGADSDHLLLGARARQGGR